MQNSGSMFAFTKLFFPICNKGSLSLGPYYFLCILQKPTEEAKALLISSPPCTRLVDIPTEAVSLAKWQVAAYHLLESQQWNHSCKPSKEVFLGSHRGRWGQGCPGQEELCCKGPLSLQAQISGSSFLNCPALQIFREEVEKRRGVYSNKAQTLAVRSFWPCLVDLHSQHPVPTIHLTLFKQYQLYWGWATCQSSQWGLQGTDSSCPFPSVGVSLNITQVAAQRSWERSSILTMHHHRAAQKASLNPILGKQQKSSFLRVHFHIQCESNLQEYSGWKV